MSTTADGTPIFNPLEHGLRNQPLMVSAAAYNKLLANHTKLTNFTAGLLKLGDHGPDLAAYVDGHVAAPDVSATRDLLTSCKGLLKIMQVEPECAIYKAHMELAEKAIAKAESRS